MLRIQEICKERGITMQELAAQIGITYQALYACASGNPTIGKLKVIASALGVNIIDLFKYEDNNPMQEKIVMESKAYTCCFVESSDVSNFNWSSSYYCELLTIPVTGDIINFKEYENEEEFDIIHRNKTKTFIVDKRILYPFSEEKSVVDWDAVIFISPYK